MPSYPLETQNKIVWATMATHNYIRKHALKDLEFDKCDVDHFYMPEVEEDEDIGGISNYRQPDNDGSLGQLTYAERWGQLSSVGRKNSKYLDMRIVEVLIRSKIVIFVV